MVLLIKEDFTLIFYVFGLGLCNSSHGALPPAKRMPVSDMELASHLGFYTYAAASAGYMILTLLLVLNRLSTKQSDPLRLPTFFWLALLSTTLWAGFTASGYRSETPLPLAIFTTELLKSVSWLIFLLRFSSDQMPDQQSWFGSFSRSWKAQITASLLISLCMTTPVIFAFMGFDQTTFTQDLPTITLLIVTVTNLIIIEQIFRNSDRVRRWAVKHLCLGLGLAFCFDLYLFSNTLLFRKLDGELINFRSLVYLLAIPLIGLSLLRLPSWSRKLQISRKVVFHTATLTGAGAYLIIMAFAGYLINLYGGSWGQLLQFAFIAGAVILLLVLMFSDKIRSNTKVLLNKHFFSYKYDYREEWLRTTRLLSDLQMDIPERICTTFSSMIKSPGCSLWSLSKDNKFKKLAHSHMPETPDINEASSLIAFLQKTQWIIDLDEWNNSPERYEQLDLPSSLIDIPQAWLILPLMFNSDLVGILLVKRSSFMTVMNWEDRDLLKIASKQSATFLAQHLATQALIEARQFEAFNRLSAYVVHDLKNILAQQSLIVTNAERHKHKPAFVDDVIKTVDNSVKRMTKLMQQMREGLRGEQLDILDINSLCKTASDRFQHLKPPLHLNQSQNALYANADQEQLTTVIGHLLQNAFDATEPDGKIALSTLLRDKKILIIIEDSGIGMSESFIRERLFKAFDSTKGLTGMGIGAYESREVIRALGGDIYVESTEGIGSKFTITIPYTPPE
jgi:putative PEP-CTERM system histidine kinase